MSNSGEINAMGASFSSGVLTLNNFSFETSAGNVVNLASGLGNVEIVLVGNNYIATTSAMVGSIAPEFDTCTQKSPYDFN